MKRTSKWFLLGTLALMVVTAMVAYWALRNEDGKAAPPPPVAKTESIPDFSKMSQKELADYFRKRREVTQASIPQEDDANAPPFRAQLLEGIAQTSKLIESQVAEMSLWKSYERCIAENQASGRDEQQSHKACIVLYNRALSDNLDHFITLAITNGQLKAYGRLRFHPDEAYQEINRILTESTSITERLVALKLIERSNLIDEGRRLDEKIYRNLESYTAPEIALLLDPRMDPPSSDPEFADKLVDIAIARKEFAPAADAAVMHLGKPEQADRLLEVVDAMVTAGWERERAAVPMGMATALGACGAACAAGFQELARASTTYQVANTLYIALFAIHDPDVRRRIAESVEGLLPPIDSLPESEREHRENVFASLQR